MKKVYSNPVTEIHVMETQPILANTVEVGVKGNFGSGSVTTQQSRSTSTWSDDED